MINELMSMKTYYNLINHYFILWFYTFLILLTSTVGHIYDKENGFGSGMVFGFVISTVLWYQFGKYYV